jgi:4'-phosphopantetheinyl transferase
MQFALSSGVQVYMCDLRTWQPSRSATLSDEEQERARRFVFAAHKLAFERAHEFLREVLAQVLKLEAVDVPFEASAHGKPQLKHTSLHFNLSHSPNYAAVAVSAHTEVGVDIEEDHPVPDAVALAQRHFTVGEQLELQAFESEPLRSQAFLAGWTRKEACLKAIGSGFSLDAHHVDAGLNTLPRNVRLNWQTQVFSLNLQSLAVDCGIIGAVAQVNSRA